MEALAETYDMVGKRLPSHLYVHKSAVCHLPADVRMLVARALLMAGEFDYDVIKVAHDESHVCLLSYPDFDLDPHPALKYSIKVVLSSGQYCISDYTKSENPPILHRKDTLVTEEYPLYVLFKSLTDAEEEQGLLSRSDIGNRNQWEALLKSKKLSIKEHSLVKRK
jgi:DNA phosphorothioation-associated putative methyltransferase